MELLSPIEKAVFQMHHDGRAVPQIAAKLGITAQEAHDAICHVWRIEKREAARRKSVKA